MPSIAIADNVTWNAPNDPHPARLASQRSYAAVARGSLDEWLAAYAEDALVEDPVGPSGWDPEGRGHRGHAGMAAFWHEAIEPMLGRLEFVIDESFANPGSNACANIGRISKTLPQGGRTTTHLVMVYSVDESGLIVSLRAFWEPARTAASLVE